MHPPLAEHQHDSCLAVVKAMKECHERNPYLKFLGLCNDEKIALNKCLRAERLDRARDNGEQAKERRREVQRRWKEIDSDQ
ncbi:hypothetical protein JCM10212_003745 [Sporobolomyces blumeae]